MGESDALLIPGHDMEVYKRYTPIADRIVKVELAPSMINYSHKLPIEWGKLKTVQSEY